MAHLGPFAVSFGGHEADEADQRLPVEEDANGVSAAAGSRLVGEDLAAEPLLGLLAKSSTRSLSGRR